MAALLLGYDVNTAKPSRARRDQEAADQPEEVPPRLLLRRRQQHERRRRLDPPHVERRLPLPARGAGQEARRNYDFEAPKEGTPINSDAYAIPTNAKHPGTAMLFIDYLLRPENAVKNINYLYYPFPVKDAVAAFDDLAKDVPACDVDVEDLENPDVFRLLGADEVQRARRRRGPK